MAKTKKTKTKGGRLEQKDKDKLFREMSKYLFRGKEAEYSDEEESDTEEYKENRHKVKENWHTCSVTPNYIQVDPVTGCEEKPGPSPLEGMSEEQKEYEAMQLVNLMDKMTRTGMIQPCR